MIAASLRSSSGEWLEGMVHHPALRPILDGATILAALGISSLLRFGFRWFEVTEAQPSTARAHLMAAAIWTASLLVAISWNRLYDEDTLFVGGGELARIVRSTFESAAFLSVFVFLTQSFYVSRSWFALVIALSACGLAGERALIRRWLMRLRVSGSGRRPAILVGSGDWEDWPFEQEHEFEVLHRVEPSNFETFVADLYADGPPAPMRDAAVVLRARDFSHDEFWRVLTIAGARQWSVFVHSPVRSVGRDRLTLRELAGQTIVKVAPPRLTGSRAVQKRAMDVVGSILLIAVTSPILIAAAASTVITAGFPILYHQERVGQDGRPFRIVKFRTMDAGAEDGTGPVRATRDDPRRTKVGRVLRRTSIDELPQLWNVLKGEMSLVGPRPERPGFVGDLSQDLTWYRFRHRIRPGITGWAQSHGLRGNTSIDSRVAFDNWYIENWSVWLDLKILLLTAREVIRGRDAY